ncbi:MAG: hypothetical protein NTW28_36770 [Candidatus Solibacter sp.]|nr:hypothetical protein [Candidatus Solibacter sp.]
MPPTTTDLASAGAGALVPEVLDRPRCAYPSLASDDKNLPAVAFWADAELPQPALRVMRKAVSGEWHTDTVPGAHGLHTALAFTSFGDPVVAWYDTVAGAVKVAFFRNGAWSTETAGTGVSGFVTGELSLAVAGGTVALSYADEAGLHVARRGGSGWTSEVVDMAGLSNGIAADRGAIHIVWTEAAGPTVKHAVARASGFTTDTVAPGAAVSLAIGPQSGTVHLALAGPDGVRHGKLSAAGWALDLVDAGGKGSPFVSLALDAQERPRVVYLDAATGGLRAALFDGAWKVAAVSDAADSASAGARQIAWADLGRINIVGVTVPVPPKEMPGLRVTIGGRRLVFAATGAVLDGVSQQPVGKWRSESAEKDNRFRYDLAGVAQTLLVAAYRLNGKNQLVLGLPGDGGATAEFTFQGMIAVDADHHFFYELIDDTGRNTGVAFTVYATGFHFAEKSNDLVVELAGGGELNIGGASGAQSLEAVRNHLPQFRADDLLTFEAVTTNVVDGEPQDFPADLHFGGTFDLERDQLVFLSEIQNTPGKSVKLGFAGKLKGVTAGFVYFADGLSTDVVLNIHGKHVFNSAGGGQTDLTWETTLGFSGQTFRAAVAVDFARTTASGNILSLNGKLRLEKAAGQTAIGPFDFELKARYGQ